jgi:carboxymethylenebutenolidase
MIELLSSAQSRVTLADGTGGIWTTPERPNGAALILIHEWWGINHNILEIAGQLADQGFAVLAADLFNGEFTDDPEVAARITGALDGARCEQILCGWAEWLRGEKGYGAIGSIGYCLGGHWALRTAVVADVDAAVIFYGGPNLPKEALSLVSGPVLGHFGLRDPIVPLADIVAFDQTMQSLGKPADVRIYAADHAFARVDGPNYRSDLALAAWNTTMDFLTSALTAQK